MAVTELGDITSTIQTFWPTLFMDDLKEDNILVNLINRDYTGALLDVGDTVKVNQIDNLTGETLSIDQAGGARTFTPETMSTTGVNITADTRFVASIDITDLAGFQSMLMDPVTGEPTPNSPRAQELRMKMVEAIGRQVNTYLYGKLAPAATAVAATLDASLLTGVRKYAVTNFWERQKGWYGLLGPSYYEDLLLAQTLVSSEFVDDRPVVGGNVGTKRFGFNLFEDNSVGNGDIGLFFHPDFLYMVTQYEPRFLISSKHSLGEFAYILSVDMVAGATLGHDGAIKHTTRTLV